MELTDEEKKMYNGEMGPGVQKAMALLVRFGTVFGAERLVKADIVHISNNIPTDMLQEMTEGADKARSQCSLHAVYDPTRFGELGIRRIKKGQTIGGGIGSQSQPGGGVQCFGHRRHREDPLHGVSAAGE